jgi:hypothetical protein
MLASAFLYLSILQQQIDQQALERAMAADAAAKTAAQSPAAGGASSAGVPPADVVPSTGGPPPPGVRAPGSSLLNPALSFILDTSFGYYGANAGQFASLGLPPAGDDPSPAREGFDVQEIEVAASAALDPYFEGAIFLTIPNLDGLEVEEGYLVTTSLPANLQIKAGTFRSQMGRNNSQHLHVQNFTRRPLMTGLLFGSDGLRGPGLQASVLLPLPWFATLYAEAFSLRAGTTPDDPTLVPTFGGGPRLTPAYLTYTAVLEQFWAPTESTSILLGANVATGRALDCPAPCADPLVAAAPRSTLYGGDLYVKWKPPNVAQTYGSVQWTTEYFARTIDGAGTQGAGYTEPVVQIARRFFVGGRFDITGLPAGDSVPRRYGYAGSLTFTPSEFTRLRLYAQELTGSGVPSTTVGFLQAEYAMGAHGAHPF